MRRVRLRALRERMQAGGRGEESAGMREDGAGDASDVDGRWQSIITAMAAMISSMSRVERMLAKRMPGREVNPDRPYNTLRCANRCR